jgi:hypothetical protein
MDGSEDRGRTMRLRLPLSAWLRSPLREDSPVIEADDRPVSAEVEARLDPGESVLAFESRMIPWMPESTTAQPIWLQLTERALVPRLP